MRTLPELLAAYDSLLNLEASGWKGARPGGYATIRSPAQVALYRDVIAGLGARGQCEINELHAEGRCIAAQFCVITGDEYAILGSPTTRPTSEWLRGSCSSSTRSSGAAPIRTSDA